jgi:hypothetical protein
VKNSRPLTLLLIPSLFITLAVVTKSARAFHTGGVGECEGCHSMHSSRGGVSEGLSGPSLLKGSDPSSTCLNCHQVSGDTGPTTYHISTPDGEIPFGMPPKQLSPGGDFAWLKKTFTWYNEASPTTTMSSSPGDSHGHNIAALDYSYLPDNYKPTAPGGAFPSIALSCVSCHDPHGKYRRNLDGTISSSGTPIINSGSLNTSPSPDSQTSVGVYRMLGGSGYNSGGLTAGLAFTYGPPVALAPANYNRAEATSYTRVAYGTGMSEWCRNCHTKIHNGSNSFEHPAPGPLGSDITNYYNSYIKTGDLSGSMTDSYLSLVPFEAGTNNYATLRSILTNTPQKGPDTADGTPQVMCLTCHRAHAGGWDAITRWNTKSSQIVSNGNYSQEALLYQPIGQGRTEAEAKQAYYQIPASKFDANQQSLCTKCHSSVPK